MMNNYVSPIDQSEEPVVVVPQQTPSPIPIVEKHDTLFLPANGTKSTETQKEPGHFPNYRQGFRG